MSETIYLRVGTHDEISLPVFIDALQNFLFALKDLDATFSRNPQGSLIWNVVALEKKSPPLIGVAPTQKRAFAKAGYENVAPRVESEFIDNARRLAISGERSEYLSDSALRHLENLAKKTPAIGPMAVFQSDNGAATPKNQTQITPSTLENVKQLTGVRYTAYGSVKGSLDAISVHRAHEFRVWDEKTNKPVTCKFGPEEIDRVKDLLKSKVMVVGILTSNSAGNPISITAEEILPISQRELPTIAEMSGLVNDFTNGKSLKEYMEELSDE